MFPHPVILFYQKNSKKAIFVQFLCQNYPLALHLSIKNYLVMMLLLRHAHVFSGVAGEDFGFLVTHRFIALN